MEDIDLLDDLLVENNANISNDDLDDADLA